MDSQKHNYTYYRIYNGNLVSIFIEAYNPNEANEILYIMFQGYADNWQTEIPNPVKFI